MTRKTLTVLAVAGALLAGLATPANATIGRPTLTNAQLIAQHDCHPITSTPDPNRLVMGWLKDNTATPQVDLVYQASKGMQLFGSYVTTHFCYR